MTASLKQQVEDSAALEVEGAADLHGRLFFGQLDDGCYPDRDNSQLGLQ